MLVLVEFVVDKVELLQASLRLLWSTAVRFSTPVLHNITTLIYFRRYII